MLRRVVRRAAVRRSPRVAPGGPAAGAPVGRGRAAAYGRGMDVRRAEDRYLTSVDWLRSRHSFSFGPHYDPANTGFGLLLVNNDDRVAPGTGFDTHPHRDMEIVTWVLEGSLVHQDSEGHNGVIHPGLAQRMSAGTGILHSERNDSWRLTGEPAHGDAVHFVQMWVLPDEAGIEPGYEQRDISAELATGALVPVASGMAGHRASAAIRIRNKDAALHAARLPSAARYGCRSRRTPTSSSRVAPSSSRVPAGWPRATRRGSRPQRGSGSPPWQDRPRSWCGRCTPPPAPDRRSAC